MYDPAQRLPPETFALVLSYLGPPTLCRCARVSKAWRAMCHDESLWKDLLLRLHYLSPSEEASILVAVTGTLQFRTPCNTKDEAGESFFSKAVRRYKDRNLTSFFDGCETLRSLCCQLWKLECNWSSRPYTYDHVMRSTSSRERKDGSPSPTIPVQDTGLHPYQDTFKLPRDGPGAWRLKLDPIESTIITTGQSGGVQVYDQATKVLLWHIPKTATRPNPHLEFSDGYIVFDRPGLGLFEVWRSERLVPDLGRPPDRGHYQRLCILTSARPIRAYRFQYPFLAMASQTGFIEIWNVPDQSLTETIDITSSIHNRGNITYIDFDDEFVFLTGIGAKSVSVFSRRSKQLVWNMGQHFANGGLRPTTYGLASLGNEGPYSTDLFQEQRLLPKAPNLWQEGPNVMNLAQLTMMLWQIWSAIHPDVKTKTLLILGQGTVLLIRDYKEFFRDTAKPPPLFVEIELWSLQDFNSRFMFQLLINQGYSEETAIVRSAQEEWNNRRFWERTPDAQMAVHEGKAFIINDVPFVLKLEDVPLIPTVPPVRVWKDRDAGVERKRESWSSCSCVQMDETGIHYISDSDDPVPLIVGPPPRITRIIRHLDFTGRGSEQSDSPPGQDASTMLQTHRSAT